jgi:hypothetical protein
VDLLMDTLRLGASPDDALGGRWHRADTRDLIALVAYEGAAIWLFRRLRAVGALDLLPAEVSDRLRQQAFESAASRMEIEAEAAAVVTILNQAGVPLILIKGLARCALADRYPYLDARATQDVDLLVPGERIADADAALRADGYVPIVTQKSLEVRGHHHLPPLHKGWITVELHSSTSIRVPSDVAWSRATDRSEIVEWAGHAVRVSSPTELAWGAAAHAMEDDVAGFRLARFLEVTALASGDAPIEWPVLRERSTTGEAFDADVRVPDQQAVIYNWLGASLSLVVAEKRPTGAAIPDFDLGSLLAWRLAVLRAAPRLGRALVDRLLSEGARSLVGLPLEPSPPGASTWGRVRRGVAGRISRAAFGVWLAARRR